MGFKVSAPESTVSKKRHPDMGQRRAEILAMRDRARHELSEDRGGAGESLDAGGADYTDEGELSETD